MKKKNLQQESKIKISKGINLDVKVAPYYL